MYSQFQTQLNNISKNVIKYYGFIVVSLLWIVLIMCQSNEAAVYFPYIYLYLFTFKNYSDNCQQNPKKISDIFINNRTYDYNKNTL